MSNPKAVTPQILGLDGKPIPRTLSNEQLRERVELLNSLVSGRKSQLTNSLTGLAARMGGMNQDNITSFLPLFTSNIYAPLTTNYTLITYLYKTHGVLQTMIDQPVEDAFRDSIIMSSKELGEDGGRGGTNRDQVGLGGSVGKGGLQELEDFLEEINAWETLKRMICWGRGYGGAGLVINSGQDPDKPLDLNDLKRGRLQFYAADRWEFPGAFRSAKTFLFYGQTLDASRVITFAGKEAPRLIRNQLAGWGMSEIERAAEDFNMWLRGRNVLYEILSEAKVDVYSIKGLAATLLLPDGEQTLHERFQAANAIKNFHNALVMDSEDEYHTNTTQLTGLADIMRENRIGMACATKIPFRKLFGSAAEGGMGGGGAEDDNENYNALVSSSVRAPARSIVRKMLRLAMYAVWGKEYDLRFEYAPLRVLSAKDEEEIKKSKQERFESLYDKRILDSKELGELLSKHKLVDIETKAQQGKLPMNPELPTTGDMFADKEGGKDGKQGAGDGEGEGGGDGADGGR